MNGAGLLFSASCSFFVLHILYISFSNVAGAAHLPSQCDEHHNSFGCGLAWVPQILAPFFLFPLPGTQW
jgi:hypothetical protein